tara:strand:- start:157 stop:402 length:246 start_codon:yes stop_codon:yes gene_type:complete
VGDLSKFYSFINGYRFRLSGLYIRTSTMGSFPKDTHKYAFALVKAARSMPIDAAKKLDHIKQLRFNVQLKVLRKRINRRIT